ncbi:LIC10965 family protein [Leptospira kmetyi]|uniref:Uncharacterized protein n=1 Tax=Leptospira kmetyi TaxID=408139 RepID=A0AAD0URP4_9LEPT|nr:hypothetical protein [Leptospira kmetyi]AYV56734.1 hypothetical protein EFP84_15345 [Leptospira kmetyi]PJZ31182.1 hypothetical protein CH378_02995 [Leptospira kmetyi]
MIAKGLKSGFLAILLTLFVSTGLHIHSERENRTFDKATFSVDQDSQRTQTCPICQFQRSAHSFWNPDFQSTTWFPVSQREKFFTSAIIVLTFSFDPIRLGRAPPLNS